MPKHDPFSGSRPAAAPRLPRVLGAIALAALLASQLRRNSAGPPRPRRPRGDWPPDPRPSRPFPRRGGGDPLPEPVRPDRPRPLQGGAAAALSFED